MAFSTSRVTFYWLLIITVCCLMGIRAEEEQPVATGNHEDKQIASVPQTYSAESPSSLTMSIPQPNGNQEARIAIQPWASMSLGNPSNAARWIRDGINDKGKLKWWKRRFNRQAVITIIPSPGECLNANVGIDGLRSCKRASDAHHGTLEVKLQTAGQTAAIAITSRSSINTRIRLICNDLNAVAVFTKTGRINAVSDTPRTEIGQMQLIVTSTAANGILKCNWRSYDYYTAAYP